MGADLTTSKKNLQKPLSVLSIISLSGSPNFAVSIWSYLWGAMPSPAKRGKHHFRNTKIYLVVGDGLLLGSPELAQLLLVLAKICLAADQHQRDTPAEVIHLRIPLRAENQKLLHLDFILLFVSWNQNNAAKQHLM